MNARRVVLWSLLVAGAALVATSAAAQQPLTLSEAVAAVLGGSDEIAAAGAAVREANQRVPQAKAGFLPHVDFTQAWQRGNQPVFVFGSLLAQRHFTDADFSLGRLNTPDPLTNRRTAFFVDQLVFDGGRTRAGVRTATLGANIAREAERQVRHDMALAATRAYGAVLRAGAERAAAEFAVNAAEEDVRTAEARRDAGTGTEADVLSMRVHLAAMRARGIDAASGVRIARAELNRLMGAPLEREIAAVEPVVAEAAMEPSEPLIDRAMRQRPDVAQSQLRLDISRAMKTSARGALLPQVAAQGGYEWNDGSRGSPASAWVAGASIRMNLFAGGANLARLRESTHAVERAQAERHRIDAAVRVEVLTAVEHLASARARHAVARSSVAYARESQRMIRDRYEAGLASASDAIRAATAALDAEAQRIGAIVDCIVAEAALRRAVGSEEVMP